jgi:membrane protein
MQILQKFIRLNIKAINNLINHDGVEHAGYMAFISFLSFFPFLIFLMMVTGLIGKSDYGRELILLLLSNIPDDLIQAIKPRVEEIMLFPPKSLLTISILSIIWTSSSAVEGLRTILNRIYQVTYPPAYIFRRMLSIIQFFIITALLVLSIFILLFLPVIYEELSNIEHFKNVVLAISGDIFTPIWENMRHLIAIITLFLGVLFLYYSIPNIKLKIKSLVPGALLVSLLWTATGSLLSKYIYEFAQLNLVYGSLAGFIITLLFFYVMHIILIYGAEVNKLLSYKD